MIAVIDWLISLLACRVQKLESIYLYSRTRRFLQGFLIFKNFSFHFWSSNWKPHSWERGWSLAKLNGYVVLMIRWLCWSTRNVHVCCVNVAGIRPWHWKTWAKNLWDRDATPFLHSASYCRQLIKGEFHIFHCYQSSESELSLSSLSSPSANLETP